MIIQIVIALAILLWVSVIVGNGQTPDAVQNATTVSKPAENAKENSASKAQMPVLTDYRAVKIGMTGDEVKNKLGKAEVSDNSGFFYKFSDNEAAQIVLDADKKVSAISITYTDKAPQITDIFGAGVEAEAKPDGSIYKLVEYPQAGYWIAYYRGAGEKPTVIVTIQKM